MKKELSFKNKENGITLIALVITIIVLLILAGVTINLTMGENGIFKTAKEATDTQKKAELRERLEIINAEYIVEKAVDNTVNENYFFNMLKQEKIISVEDDVQPIEGVQGAYTIKTAEGDIIEIIVDQNKNILIGEIAKENTLKPKISNVNIKTTSTSINITAIVTRLYDDGHIKYYYQEVGASEYTVIEEQTQDTATQITGIMQGKAYNIKIVATNKNGSVEVIKENIIAEDFIEINEITLDQNKAYMSIGKTLMLNATITPNNATNQELEWTSSNEKIVSVDENGTITGIKEANETVIITAKAKDGSGIIATCQVEIRPTIYLYDYGDKGTDYSSGWNYIGGRYYSAGTGTSYAKYNADNIELYYGGYIGTILNDDYLEKYKYLCIKSTSENTRNRWTAFQVVWADNFDSYNDSYAWGSVIASHQIINHNDYSLWEEKTDYIDLTQYHGNTSKYFSIQTCEGRDAFIYQVYLSNTIE